MINKFGLSIHKLLQKTMSLKLCLLLSPIIFLSCTKEIKFKIIENRFDYATYDDVSEKEIKYAHKFIDLIVDSYQSKCIESGLRKFFFDSMSLMNSNNISVNYYFSKSRESMISIFKSNENRFTSCGTEFPVQFF